MRKKSLSVPRAHRPSRMARRAAAQAMVESLEPRTLLTVDLSGSFLSFPTRVLNGSTAAVSLSVANNGNTTAAGTAAIAFYATPDGSALNLATDKLLTTVSRTLSITGGHTQTINVPNLPISGALVAGSYHIDAVLDSAGKFTETDEGNNVVQSGVVVVAQSDYNLVGAFTGTSLPPAIVQGVATRENVKVNITNSSGSTATIPAGTSVQVKLVARPNNATDSSLDVLLTAAPLTAAVGNLAPGKSRLLAATVTFPAGLSDGTYNLVAIVDTGGGLAEINETDNEAAFTHSVVVAAPFSDAALTFDAGTVVPANVVADGRKMPLTFDVTNMGNIKMPSGQTSSIAVALSGISSTTQLQSLTINLAGLAPGATRTFAFSPTITLSLPDGTYSVDAQLTTAAAGNLTGNDSASAATSLTSGPAFFNLGVATPSITTFTPAVINGQPTSASVSVGVENLSNTNLPANTKVNLTVALRPANATDSSQDFTIGVMNNVNLGSLALGGTKMVKVNCTIPATLAGSVPITSGDYTFVATVTPVALAESTGADNTAAGGTVTIAAPFVDLAIVSATQNFFTPAANGALAAGTVQLRNMGNVEFQGNITIQFYGTPSGTDVPALLGTHTFSVDLLPGVTSVPLSQALTLNISNNGQLATPVAVTARIDPTFVDANTGNNQLGAGTVIRSSQYVDLTILSATNPLASQVSANATASGQVVIANIGSGTGSGLVTVTYEAISSADSSITILGTQTASISLGLAQISAPVDVSLTIPGGLTSGPTYTLKALISADLTLDNNPNNNLTTTLGTFLLL